MTIKKELGQFYSKNKELIFDFMDKVSLNDILIDPFAGELDLLKLFENKYEAYDIVEMPNCTLNDSLRNPPSYKNKFIITNPPYLALNKTTNNIDIFQTYQTDDLYKASLLSFLNEAEKGIIIIPTGFWFNERNSDIRSRFLSKFRVEKVVVFNKQMFSDTTYSVCSFYFEKQENIKQTVSFKIIDSSVQIKTKDLDYGENNSYSILMDVQSILLEPKIKYKVGRYTAKNKTNVSNIFLRCLDTSSKIQASIEEPYMGIETDRAFLTFTIDPYSFSKEDEIRLVELFNQELTDLRETYQDSFLSNYRNDGRKRIGFNFAYKLLKHCICLLEEEKALK